MRKAASLSQAVDAYLQSVVATKAPRTAAAYKLVLHQFAKARAKNPAQVTQDDLTVFAVKMKQDGMSDRTIANPERRGRSIGLISEGKVPVF